MMPALTVIKYMYSKCSKISNTKCYLFSAKMLVIRTGIHKIHVSKASRGYPDQTASSEAVLSGSHLFVQAFLLGK